MDQQSLDAAVRSGLEALRRGDGREAKAVFDRIVGQGASPPWLAVAQACNLLGDLAGEEQALERQLDRDMRDLPSLLAMGDLKARKSDRRAAGAFFRTALNVASVRPVPPQLQPLLQRAAAYIEETKREFEAHLTGQLAQAGISDRSATPRMRQALDLLLGRTQLYLQQPNMFYFPGLPQRAFYEREEFDWIGDFEAGFAALRSELGAVLEVGREFDPYVGGSPDRPLPNNKLLNDPAWGAWYLWQSGTKVEGHWEQCPKTMAALELAPMPVIGGRSPMALYSLLKPGTHIAPHHGMLNTRLICHMPLIVPENCAIRVGAETRTWQEGRMLIFDDSFEHEAWNRSNSNRIVLIFEIWRPEIEPTEREELTALFETIDLLPGGDGPDS